MPGLGRRQAVAATRVVRRPGSPRRGARPGRTRGRVVPSKIHPPDLPRDAAHGRRSSPDGGCRQTSERCGELRQSTDSAGEARGRSRGRATAVPPAVPARWPTDLHISGVAGGADGRWKVDFALRIPPFQDLHQYWRIRIVGQPSTRRDRSIPLPGRGRPATFRPAGSPARARGMPRQAAMVETSRHYRPPGRTCQRLPARLGGWFRGRGWPAGPRTSSGWRVRPRPCRVCTSSSCSG